MNFSSDVDALLFIVGLGLFAIIFAKLIAKPFDKLMDLRYPNDRQMSYSEIRKGWAKK